jgi:hypothetical protein
MKRYNLLILILLMSGNIVFGQSIPNGDFESWNTKAYFNLDSGWYNSNIKSLSLHDSLTVWKVPGFIGQAIHIQTAIVGSDTLEAYITNSAGDPTKAQGGVPYSQKPIALTGYYKCNVMSGDSAGVIVIFKTAGSVIAVPSKVAFTGSTSVFTPFSIPIAALPLTPDTIIIAAASSNLLNNSIGLQSGSWLELDQLTFVGAPTFQPIVNGSFDAWVSASFDLLSGWQAQAGGQGNGVTKTTDHYSGSYAVMLQTYQGDHGPNQAQLTTGLMTKNNGPHGGLPYTKTADTLTGYYKYTTPGGDSGQVFINVTKSGSPVGGTLYRCPAAATWTYFQIPFSASSTPDSIRVDLVSSSFTNPKNGSTFYVDKMQLKPQPLSINRVNGGAGIVSIYPNPVVDVLHLSLNSHIEGAIELRLYDVNGQLVLSTHYNTTNGDISVPVGQLATGTYVYEIKNNGIVISDKFVKQ